MKLFQWMSKKSKSHKKDVLHDEQVRVRDIVVYKKADHEGDNEGNDKNKVFSFGPERESCRSCFHKTLNLKHIKSIYGNQHGFWEKRREVFHQSKKDESAIVPCKVQNVKDDGKAKNVERKKPASKMKELLKWAAASKSHKEGNKGWKASKNESRGTAELKAPSDYSSTRSSSKTSSRWDIGSCSTSSSIFSSSSGSSRNLQYPPVDNFQSKKEEYCKRTGHWISTDSHFVVLELTEDRDYSNNVGPFE